MQRYQRTEPLIVSAGFPCQDASKANPNGKGINGERTRLFYEALRIAHELGAEYLFLENVANLLMVGWDEVIRSLTESGYCVWYRTVSAETIGYPFQGKRIYAVAFSPATGVGLDKVRIFDEYFEKHLSEKARENYGLCRKISLLLRPETYTGFHDDLDGVPSILVPARLHAIGNAIIPDFAEVVFKTIKEFHNKIINHV